jgi:Protein of unknown function (DUF3122)
MMFKQSLSRLLVVLTLSIALFFGICQPAIAAITQIEEYPGQMLYQSRQNLQDQTGKAWQAIELEIPSTIIQEWQTLSAY